MSLVRACWTIVVPLLIIAVAAIVLFATGDKNGAWAVSFVGTPTVMLLNGVYVVVWHSRSRWPGLSWIQRLTKVVWSQR